MNLIQTSSDLEEFSSASKEMLQHLSQDKEELRKLVLKARDDETLFSLCEHYDILDKIVLWTSEDQKIRLRLHVFADDYFDRPHNHRWSYSSYILSGGYQHTVYTLNHDDAAPSSKNLIPVIIRREIAGDFYALHFSQYHSVIAGPNTVTLVMRGAPERDRFRVMDRVTEESWWQYGAAQESEKERDHKKMTPERFDFLVTKLMQLRII
jgi:hypothetical protein